MTTTTLPSVPYYPESSVAERTFRKNATLQEKILCWFCELHPEERVTAMEGSSECLQHALRKAVFCYRSQVHSLRDTLDLMREYGRVEMEVNPCLIFGSIRFDTIDTFCPRTALGEPFLIFSFILLIRRIDVIARQKDPIGKPIPLPMQSAFDWNGEIIFRRRYLDKTMRFYLEADLTWIEEEDYSNFEARDRERESYSDSRGDSWEDADKTAIA